MKRDEFYKLVDSGCYARFGCSMHDLPDFPYSDYYDGPLMSHKEMVYAADLCVDDMVHELKYDCNEYESLRWL